MTQCGIVRLSTGRPVLVYKPILCKRRMRPQLGGAAYQPSEAANSKFILRNPFHTIQKVSNMTTKKCEILKRLSEALSSTFVHIPHQPGKVQVKIPDLTCPVMTRPSPVQTRQPCHLHIEQMSAPRWFPGGFQLGFHKSGRFAKTLLSCSGVVKVANLRKALEEFAKQHHEGGLVSINQ